MACFSDLAEEILLRILKDLNQVCSEDHEYKRIVYKERQSIPIFSMMGTTGEQPHVKGYEAILEYAKVCTQWRRVIEELDQERLLEELPSLKHTENTGYSYNMDNFVNCMLVSSTLQVLSEYGVQMQKTKDLYPAQGPDSETDEENDLDDGMLEMDSDDLSDSENASLHEDVDFEEEDDMSSLSSEGEDEDEDGE